MTKNILKRIARMLLPGILIISLSAPVYAQYTRIWQHYFDRAREEISQKNYRSALLYLETARSIEPENPRVTEYLNLVKRALQDRIVESSPSEIVTVSRTNHRVASSDSDTAAVSDSSEKVPERSIYQIEKSKFQKPLTAKKTVRSNDILAKDESKDESKDASREIVKPVTEVKPLASPAVSSIKRTPPDERIHHYLELDEEAWSEQPDMDIELGMNEDLLIRGDNIHRYLAVTPEIVDIQLLGNRELLIVPINFGRTFLHVWEDGRRWTFNIRTTFKTRLQEQQALLAAMQVRAQAFKLLYDFNWNSFSRGPSLDNLDRQSLNVSNYFSLYGPTPYGDFDTYASFYKTDTISTDLTDYSIGLSGASWKNLKDINVRIFDATKRLSDLTMPGRDFRGILLEGRAQNERFAFTALRGEDQSSFGMLTPGAVSSRESYFEGGTISYLPDSAQRFSINYAHAWGEDKPVTSKSNVFSGEYEIILPERHFLTEIGYDEDQLAAISWSRFSLDAGSFYIKLRDIPRDYATATGPPGAGGEVGAEMSLYHEWWGGAQVSHFLDLYRDRENKNPDDENAVNIDFSTNIVKELSYRDTVSGDLYFIHTPGVLSDRTDTRVSSKYLRRFNFFNIENAGISLTGMYQRARSDASPSSDYNRTGLITLLNLPITRNLNFSTGYEFYYVNDVAIDEKSYPTVFNTSLFYSRNISDQWRTGFSLYYRDEENTEDEKSFMAGQDSLTIGTNLTYRPRSGLTFYLDGRIREVWAENSTSDSFTEADIRLGLRSEWDLGFSWSPTGIVQGYVFRDLNDNEIKDPDEDGIPGVRVIVGNQDAVTDDEGWYYAEVNAVKAKVGIDIDTIPDSYIFQNQGMRELNIQHQQYYNADFALSAQAGIYGVVYFDENGNGRPDNGDLFLNKVKLMLDHERVTATDSKGAFFFYNISPGDHQIVIDLNSLPPEYLPTIPLSNNINVAEGATYIFHVPVKKSSPSPNRKGRMTRS